MSQNIDVKGVGLISFPNEMSGEDIQAALDKEFLPKVSGPAAFATEALKAVGPAIGGAVGLGVGGLIGLPTTGPGGIAAALAGGMAGGEAVAIPQEYLLNKIPGYPEYERAVREQHPILAGLGDWTGAAAGFKVQPLRGMGGLPKMIRGVATKEEASAVRGALAAGGLGAGLGVVDPLLHGQAPTASGVIQSALFPFIYGDPRFNLPGSVRPTPFTPEESARHHDVIIKAVRAAGKEAALVEGEIPDYPNNVIHTLADGSVVGSKKRINQAMLQAKAHGIPEAEALQKMVEEEVIHGLSRTDPVIEKMAKDRWESLTPFERWLEKKRYGGKLSDADYAHESLRFWLQRASGNPSEFIFGSMGGRVTARFLTGLQDIVGTMRERLGGKATPFQVDTLKKINYTVEQAKIAITKGLKDAVLPEATQPVPAVQPQPGQGEGQVSTEAGGAKAGKRGRKGKAELAISQKVLLTPQGSIETGLQYGPQEPQMGEVLTAAAFVNPVNNKIHYGSNHPDALHDAGGKRMVKRFDKEPDRNIPLFGYQTNRRPFVSRELAAKIAEKSGQQIPDEFKYKGRPHSHEIRSATQPERSLATQTTAPPAAQPVGAPTAPVAKGRRKVGAARTAAPTPAATVPISPTTPDVKGIKTSRELRAWMADNPAKIDNAVLDHLEALNAAEAKAPLAMPSRGREPRKEEGISAEAYRSSPFALAVRLADGSVVHDKKAGIHALVLENKNVPRDQWEKVRDAGVVDTRTGEYIVDPGSQIAQDVAHRAGPHQRDVAKALGIEYGGEVNGRDIYFFQHPNGREQLSLPARSGIDAVREKMQSVLDRWKGEPPPQPLAMRQREDGWDASPEEMLNLPKFEGLPGPPSKRSIPIVIEREDGSRFPAYSEGWGFGPSGKNELWVSRPTTDEQGAGWSTGPIHPGEKVVAGNPQAEPLAMPVRGGKSNEPLPDKERAALHEKLSAYFGSIVPAHGTQSIKPEERGPVIDKMVNFVLDQKTEQAQNAAINSFAQQLLNDSMPPEARQVPNQMDLIQRAQDLQSRIEKNLPLTDDVLRNWAMLYYQDPISPIVVKKGRARKSPEPILEPVTDLRKKGGGAVSATPAQAKYNYPNKAGFREKVLEIYPNANLDLVDYIFDEMAPVIVHNASAERLAEWRRAAKMEGGKHRGEIGDPDVDVAAAVRRATAELGAVNVKRMTQAQQARYLQEVEDRVRQVRKKRVKLEADLTHWLRKTGTRPDKDPMRPKVDTSDVHWDTHDSPEVGPYREFHESGEQDPKVFHDSRVLDDASAGTSTETRRLSVFVRNSDNTVHAVSTYRHPTTKEIMVYNPDLAAGNKTGKYKNLTGVMLPYRLHATMLLKDPVHNFHQEWKNLAEFDKEIGSYGRAATALEGGQPWLDYNKLQRSRLKREKERVARERFGVTLKEVDAKIASLEGQLKATKGDTAKEIIANKIEALKAGREDLAKQEEARNAPEPLPEEPKTSEELQELNRIMAGEMELGQRPGVAEGHLAAWSDAADVEMSDALIKEGGSVHGPGTDIWKQGIGLLKTKLRNLLRGPVTETEARGIIHLYNSFEINEPADIKNAMEILHKVSKMLSWLDGKPLGYRGWHRTAMSGLAKISRYYQAERWKNPDVKADFRRYVREKMEQNPSGDKAERAAARVKAEQDYMKALRYEAFTTATREIHKLAQQSRNVAVKERPPWYADPRRGLPDESRLPFHPDTFAAEAVGRYGETGGRDLRAAADARKREAELIGPPGREQFTLPGYYARDVVGPPRGREIPPITPEEKFAQQWVPGRPAPQPSAPLPPEAQAAVEARAAQLHPDIPRPAYAALPLGEMAPRFKDPRTRRIVKRFSPAYGGEPPPEFKPSSGLRDPRAGPLESNIEREIPRTTLKMETGRPEAVPEDVQRYYEWLRLNETPRNPMEEAPLGMRVRGGVSKAVKEERAGVGKGLPPSFLSSAYTDQELVERGARAWKSGEINHEEAMREAEGEGGKGTGKISQLNMSVCRFYAGMLQNVAEKYVDTLGPNHPETRKAMLRENNWWERFYLAFSQESSEMLRTLKGEQDLESGSYTGMRRSLRKRMETSGEVFTDEHDRGLQRRSREIRKGKKEIEEVQGAIGHEIVGEAPTPPGLKQFVDQAKADIAREGQGGLDAFVEGEQGPKPSAMPADRSGKPVLSPAQMQRIAVFGASKMMELSRRGEFTQAEWNRAMLESKAGPYIKDHLEEIWMASDQKRMDMLNKYVGSAPASAEARKAVGGRKRPSLEESEAALRSAIALDPKAKRVTTDEAYHLWNVLKYRYFDTWTAADGTKHGGVYDLEKIRVEMANMFGTDPERIMQGMDTNRTVKTLTDEMWKKLRDQARIVNEAHNWMKNAEYPRWYQWARRVPRGFFVAKIFGHGYVGLITHAGNMVFNPYTWTNKQYWHAWKEMYHMANPFDPEGVYHQKATSALKNEPDFPFWIKAGLEIDPFRHSDDYSILGATKFFNRWAGGRGFDALKILRLARARQLWAATPAHLRVNLDGTPNMEMAALWAKSVNHATGIVKGGGGPGWELANWTLFAPKLEFSRWAFLFRDTIKAASSWNSENPALRQWARQELKEKALMTLAYASLLWMNRGLLYAIGSDQKINMSDPTKPDFLQFKVHGFQVGITTPLIGMIRMFGRLLNSGYDVFGGRSKVHRLEPRQETMMSDVGKYVRGKLSPFGGTLWEAAAQQDPIGRPLPWSRDRMPMSRLMRGEKPYTTGEYLWQRGPIPIEEAAKVWYEMGVDKPWTEKMLNGIMMAGPQMMTGVRVSEDLMLKR